jgi:hypothetical protein
MGGYGEDQPVLRIFLCANQGQLPRAARERPTISSKRVIRSRKRKPRSVNRSNSVKQGCLEPQEEAL